MSQPNIALLVPNSLPILPLPPNQGPLFPGLVLSIQLASRTSINLLRAVIRDVENAPHNKQAFVGICPQRIESSADGRGKTHEGEATEAKVEVPPGTGDPSPDEQRHKGLQVIKLPRDELDGPKKPKVDDIYEWCVRSVLSVFARCLRHYQGMR